MSELAEQLLAGDRRALARAITLVESSRPDHRADALALLDEIHPHAGNSVRVGITGPPGVGKSTFIEALGTHLVGTDHRVAVLAVDPSSSVSGGSILGDKTRMTELGRSDRAFIRPTPSGDSVGGVARRTREVIDLVEAAGFSTVLVETVGSGQSDVAAADLVDALCLLVPPGGGDELQGIKRGIMERTDAVVVTRADGESAALAQRTVADYQNALHLLRGAEGAVTAVSSVEGIGIADAWALVEVLMASARSDGSFARRRADQAVIALWQEVRTTLVERMAETAAAAGLVAELEQAVRTRDLSPGSAAQRLLDGARP